MSFSLVYVCPCLLNNKSISLSILSLSVNLSVYCSSRLTLERLCLSVCLSVSYFICLSLSLSLTLPSSTTCLEIYYLTLFDPTCYLSTTIQSEPDVSVCLSVCLPFCLSIYSFLSLLFRLTLFNPTCYLSTTVQSNPDVSVCLPVCLSVFLSVYCYVLFFTIPPYLV